MYCNCDPNSNINDVSKLQCEKHERLKTLTDAGRKIAVSRLLENANAPICSNCDPDSNTTEVIEVGKLESKV
jgi:hypothetical protein